MPSIRSYLGGRFRDRKAHGEASVSLDGSRESPPHPVCSPALSGECVAVPPAGMTTPTPSIFTPSIFNSPAPPLSVSTTYAQHPAPPPLAGEIPVLPAPPLPVLTTTSQHPAPPILGGSGISTAPLSVSITPAQLPTPSLVSTVKTPTPPVTTVKIPALPGPADHDRPFGLKVLVEGRDPDVDLVAVHGLDGHWETTWTADNGVSLLHDLLPQAIPNLRILTWGYDGRTYGTSPLSCQSFHDHALALITDLTARRRETNTQQRAIIFIAHGAGGIIVKDALIHSNSANKSNLEHHKAIKTSTCGVLFFGTPHQGSEGISWSQMILNTGSVMTKKNKALLRELEENSASLQKQLAQYNHISSDFETKFFYECYAAAGGEIIVPQSAAVVPGATNAESYAVNADHGGLVKFKAVSDSGFKKVSLCISLVVDKAPAKALENWEQQRLVAGNEGVQMTTKVPFELEYLRNPRFTGRKLLLDALYTAIQNNRASGQSKPIILYGTGGIGKSQVVVEYLYAHQKEHTSIFWINSATPEMAILSFRSVAQRLIKEHAKISLKSQPHYPTIAKDLGMVGVVNEDGLLSPDAKHNECIINGIKLWLSQEENRDWLLVFDNVDDLETLRIETFMPSTMAGNIIMTSRRSDCAHFGVGLEVKEMTKEEGVELLLSTARLPANDPIAIKTTEVLGYLPLALVQAGAFVAARHISLENFLEIYHESYNRAFAKKQPRGVGTYDDRSILTTWEISFTAIRKMNKDAAELLSLCSFLFNEVQQDMLCRGGMVKANGVTLDESMELLYTYSLAHPQHTSGSFYIHPVVHRWAKERLTHPERVKKAQEAVNLITSVIERPSRKRMEHWRYERSILPHIDCVTNNFQEYLTGPGAIFPVLTSCLTLLDVNAAWGRTNEAHRIATDAHVVALRFLGRDHAKTTLIKERLACIYSEQGRIDEGAKMGQEILEANKRNLGFEHRHTIATMGNLASTYSKQGRWYEAEKLELKVLEASKRNLGLEHPDTLSAMGNLARTYFKQGRWDEAEKLELEALEAKKRNLGLEHPDTVSAMGNLAGTYSKQGRWDESEKLRLEALEASKRNLGLEHPDTLSAMGNLASTYFKQGRWDEAEKLELEALEAKKRNLGLEHPDTVSAMGNLAGTYSKQGRWDESEKLRLEALEARKRILGLEHPDTISAMGNLAGIYYEQGRLDEAEKLKLEVLEARKRILGLEHPDTVSAMALLACTYSKQGRLDEAEKLKLKVLEARKRNLGLEHPDTVSAMAGLAVTYCLQGRWDEAEKLLLEVLEARNLGFEHPDTISVMVNLAGTYLAQGRLARAHELLLEASDIGERTQASGQPFMIKIKSLLSLTSHTLDMSEGQDIDPKLIRKWMKKQGNNNLLDLLPEMVTAAEIHIRQDRFQEAEQLLERAVTGRQEILGLEHPDTLAVMASLASTYGAQKKWDKAERLQQQVVDARQRILGSDHLDTLSAMVHLASTHSNQGWWEKAEQLEWQVVDVRQRVLGIEHPDTLSAIESLAVSYRMQGQYKEAGELHRQVVEATEKLRGSEHPATVTAMANLASTYGNQGRWEEAEEFQKIIMDIRERQLGRNHPDTQRAMTNLICTYRKRGRYEEARSLRAHPAAPSQVILNHNPSTLEEMCDLATSYVSEGRVEDLQQLLFETAERRGSEDLITTSLKGVIAGIYRLHGFDNEASILREQVIETLQRTGAGDPESLLRLAERM